LGVPSDRLIKITYGKERPQCAESNETCWQQNRRVHFTPADDQKTSSLSPLDDSTQRQPQTLANSARQ